MKLMFIMKVGVLSIVTACLSCCSGRVSGSSVGSSGGSDELKCRVMEVEGGYGYVVLCGSDTLIYQPFIPAVGGRKAFATKEEALNAGKLVCKKLFEGEPPTLSEEEVRACNQHH